MDSFISKALIKKDLTDIFRSKTLLVTMIVIPIVFSVVFPAALIISALLFDLEKIAGEDGRKLVSTFSESSMSGAVAAYSLEQQMTYIFINFMLPTLFLLVPIITAMTVAANSFVGEKERRTLESLLFSPVPMHKLFLSKIAASFIPPFLVSITSFLACGIIINTLGYPLFQELIFPSANWIVLIACLSPMIILLVVLINILISARVKTYQEAQNIGGVIVLPVVGMLVGQVSGLFLLGAGLMLIISLGVFLINLVLLQRIFKHNDRFKLFEKQIN